MIHILPDPIVDRIAAGEVVERPASVVKELMENSIDAGASRIEVLLEAGGKKMIKVVDDGAGMAPGDLQAAFMRHATSKLDNVEDLDHIGSLGFRGEALASIGAVADARITSRRTDRPEGAAVENRGGKILPVRPAPAPAGTAVEVRHLFKYVPARLKFLKGDATELSHCVEAVTRQILAWPGVEVRLSHNGKTVLFCERNLSLRERIESCFGGDLAELLLPVEGTFRGVRLTGFVGRPEGARKDRKRSYLFVNGRHVKDRVVHAAVLRAFRERLSPRLTPVYFLNLVIPPEEVDVNVHPMKLEVRFRDGTRVFAAVLRILEDSLAEREGGSSRTPWVVREAPRFMGAASVEKGSAGGGPRASFFRPGPNPPGGSGRLAFGLDRAGEGGSFIAGRRVTMRAAGRFLQVHGSYLLFEVEEGVAVVDQHALHERVLFEKLREEYDGGGILLQKLLVPVVVEVSRDTAPRLESVVHDLKRLGIEAEPFGAAALKVTAIPSILGKVDPGSFTRTMVEEIAAGREGESAYLDLLHSMACRGAVRSGDRLDEEEQAELIAHMERAANAGHCPHGRPTTVLVTLKELEEMFKRRGF